MVVKITSGKELLLSRFGSLISNTWARRHSASWKAQRCGAEGWGWLWCVQPSGGSAPFLACKACVQMPWIINATVTSVASKASLFNSASYECWVTAERSIICGNEWQRAPSILLQCSCISLMAHEVHQSCIHFRVLPAFGSCGALSVPQWLQPGGVQRAGKGPIPLLVLCSHAASYPWSCWAAFLCFFLLTLIIIVSPSIDTQPPQQSNEGCSVPSGSLSAGSVARPLTVRLWLHPVGGKQRSAIEHRDARKRQSIRLTGSPRPVSTADVTAIMMPSAKPGPSVPPAQRGSTGRKRNGIECKGLGSVNQWEQGRNLFYL